MKNKHIKFNIQEIRYADANTDRSIELQVGMNEKDISSMLDNFELKEIFYCGSYNVQEIVDAFGLEEIAEYINGLGER